MDDRLYNENDRIIASIWKARRDVEEANMLFNELTDDKAVDYASYNLLAAKTRYSYLLQIAKEKGMSI